jgi:molybdopterin/thiamine biosynthesis adenylyltransferase
MSMFDLSRIRPHFDADKFIGTIAVVGLGAIGSRVACLLNEIGLGHGMHLYDGDRVEGHNLSSQVYEYEDVGRWKATALYDRLKSKWDDLSQRSAHIHYVTNQKLRHDVVILCVDSMRTRKQIMQHCVWLNGQTSFVMDARITATTIFSIGFNPTVPSHFRQYMDEAYDDPDHVLDAQMGGCDITPSVAPTAAIAASLLVTQLMAHIKGENPPQEVVVNLKDFSMEKRCYGDIT